MSCEKLKAGRSRLGGTGRMSGTFKRAHGGEGRMRQEDAVLQEKTEGLFNLNYSHRTKAHYSTLFFLSVSTKGW